MESVHHEIDGRNVIELVKVCLDGLSADLIHSLTADNHGKSLEDGAQVR